MRLLFQPITLACSSLIPRVGEAVDCLAMQEPKNSFNPKSLNPKSKILSQVKGCEWVLVLLVRLAQIRRHGSRNKTHHLGCV